MKTGFSEHRITVANKVHVMRGTTIPLAEVQIKLSFIYSFLGVAMYLIYLFLFLFPLTLYSQGGWLQQTSGTSQLLRSVYFVDSEIGWVVGDNGRIIKTTNAGQHWVQQSSGTNIVIEGVHFINPSTGWVVGNSGLILHTSDGGTTWTLQNSNTQRHLRSLFLVDSQTGWAVGSSETIIKTSDGGNSWSTQLSGDINNLRSICFSDPYNGWAVGDGGKIFHTSNGGNIWSEQNSGTSRILTSVFFNDSLKGWVTGTSGTILKTTDGGLTWEMKNSGTSAGLYSVWSYDEYTGWVTGNDGVILRTTNGGETWTLESSGTFQWLWSINFNNPNIGWAAGWAGTVLRYYQTPPLSNPLLSSPVNNGGSMPDVTFVWHSVENAESYRLQLSSTYSFTTRLYDFAGINDTTLQVTQLPHNSTFYWRVIASSSNGESFWSDVWSFNTIITSLHNDENLPAQFSLMQNYPNPFNPVTNVQYVIGSSQFVTLRIFDVLGREVASLVNEYKEAGTHTVEFDAEGLPSGVYLYWLQTGSFIQTKKMIFLQ